MSENNNEQMDIGSNTTSNNESSDIVASATSPSSEMAAADNQSSSKIQLSIKTPKEKKDIAIDASSTIKQVSHIREEKNIRSSLSN